MLSLILLLTISTLAATPLLDIYQNINSKEWNIVTDESKVGFVASHFGISVNGEFHDYKAEIRFDYENLNRSSVTLKIQAESVDTDNNRRDNHLRDADFFETETWPHITFESNNFIKNGDSYSVTGTLTIKETSTDVTVPFSVNNVADNLIILKIGDFELNRYDYGVGTDSFMERRTVSNVITIDIELHLKTESAI